MPNFHNWYKIGWTKNFTEKPEYMLNYSLPCTDGVKFEFILIKQQQTLKKFLFLVTEDILNGGQAVGHTIERGPYYRNNPTKFDLISFISFRGEDL